MKTTDMILRWLPRVICITAILFVSMFALDSFNPGLSFFKQITAFLIHLIPSFILAGMLFVAWKWELTGGIILTVTGIFLCFLIFYFNYRQRHAGLANSLITVLVICVPFVIAGVLFIFSHLRRNKNRTVSLKGISYQQE